MLASQFNLDHRLAELRLAGENLRAAQACAAAAQPGHSTSRSLIGWLRSLVGASAAGSRPVGLGAR